MKTTMPYDKLMAVAKAAEILGAGGLVAFPTETVYGLGADARSSEAVSRIFAAKGRPADNPLIVHIARREQLAEIVQPYPAYAERLMDAFWPGPLTLVLPVREGALSPLVTAGLDTVGVRMPRHEAALALLGACGCPVAAPSANRSGKPSPTLAQHVIDDIGGALDGIVDGGAAGVGLESTVVQVDKDAVRLLRPGSVTTEDIARVLPGVPVIGYPAAQLPDAEATPRSPGMKYRHYAPEAALELVLGEAERVSQYIAAGAALARQQGKRTGVLAFDEHASAYRGAADIVLSLGSKHKLEEAGQRLYAALRHLDAEGVQAGWAEGVTAEGAGAALMNRITRAASDRVTTV